MKNKQISGGTVHELPVDLKDALASNTAALELWEGLTPLARNEWICWTIFIKQPKTRKQHVERVMFSISYRFYITQSIVDSQAQLFK